MAKAWISFFAFFCAVVAAEQQTLAPTSAHGILRRFNSTANGFRETVLEIAQNHDLDVWHVGRTYIDVYSPPEALDVPEDLGGIPHTATLVPLSHQLWQDGADSSSNIKAWNLTSLTNSTFHETYHSLSGIRKFLTQLVELNPNTTSLSRIGLSAENRDILALSIVKPSGYAEGEPQEGVSKKGGKKKMPRPAEKLDFVIIGAQHAREWIATATSLYLAHALTIDQTLDEPHGLSSLLDAFNFHIIPVPNPDGYHYTWKKDRYWYKNRQIVAPHSKCVGVDMNRNWGYKWKAEEVPGNPAEPADPCSHWYPGSRAFESPEVNSIANFISTLHNPVAFVDLRSYGQMISTPYSYTCKRFPKDGEDQAEAAFGAARAMKDVHDEPFQVGRLCENLYKAPGNIIDWMYQRAYIKYSYVVHLRDTGTWGFSLPAKWIKPVGEETSSMIEYLAKFIVSHRKVT
ncbi:preprocarboxypeptidase A2 [Coprinopsis cinerea AmutBmut pab1-1]|nr:preprocarboxypeptidase A2 [Coprinopsis cinerea AmutBmut pab1-1]